MAKVFVQLQRTVLERLVVHREIPDNLNLEEQKKWMHALYLEEKDSEWWEIDKDCCPDEGSHRILD